MAIVAGCDHRVGDKLQAIGVLLCFAIVPSALMAQPRVDPATRYGFTTVLGGGLEIGGTETPFPTGSRIISQPINWSQNGSSFDGAFELEMPQTVPALLPFNAPGKTGYYFAENAMPQARISITGKFTYPNLTINKEKQEYNSVSYNYEAVIGHAWGHTSESCWLQTVDSSGFPAKIYRSASKGPNGYFDENQADITEPALACSVPSFEYHVDAKGWYLEGFAALGLSLSFNDIKGSNDASVNLRGWVRMRYDVTGEEEKSDVRVDRIELVQTVQTEAHRIPMVAGKSTVARVFVSTDGNDVNGVSARLYGYRGDQLKGSPLAPFNGPITASSSWTRGIADSSLNFLIPVSWTEEGLLELEAHLVLPPGTGDKDESNNTRTRIEPYIRTKDAGDTFAVGYFPLCYHPPQLAAPMCPDAIFANAATRLSKLFPLADNGLDYFEFPVALSPWRKPILDNDDEEELGAALRKLFLFVDSRLQGFVDQVFIWLPWAAAEIDGVRHIPHGGSSDPIWANKTNLGTSAWGEAVDNRHPLFAETTLAHEIAHNLGRRHPNTPDGCGARDPDTDWPYGNATIQEPGFDPRAQPEPAFVPSFRKDLMSYCEPRSETWIATYTYEELFDANFAPQGEKKKAASDRRSATALPALRFADAPRDYLLVSGHARKDRVFGELEPLYRITTRLIPPELDENGNYCVEVSSGGGVASKHCFDLPFTTGELYPTNRGSFAILVPVVENVTEVTLTDGGRELTSITKSTNAPQVQITSPTAGGTWEGGGLRTITWTGVDADGQSLHYTVQYSPDGGGAWYPLAVDLTETRYEFDTTRIQGGGQVRFRVIGTDGLLSDTKEVGPVNVVQRPEIGTPEDEVNTHKGVIGQIRKWTFPLENKGTGPLEVTNVTSDSDAFTLSGTPATIKVPAGKSRNLVVDFKPTHDGEHTGKLTLTSNAPGKGTYEIHVRGHGIVTKEPDAEVSPTAVDFGATAVGTASERAITLENFGPGDLRVNSVVSDNPLFTADSDATPYDIGPVRQRMTLRFAPVADGAQTATLTITTNDPDHPVLEVALSGTGAATAGPRPLIYQGGVADAARGFRLVAPGGIASLYGQDLAGTVAQAGRTPLPTILDGVQVLVNGVPAPLFFISSTQINFQIPFEITPGVALQVVVVRNGVQSPPVTVQSAQYAPAVFTNPSTGDPIVQRHPDYAVITRENPAKADDVLIIYLTGVGGLTAPPATGAPAKANPLSTSLAAPAVMLGGTALTVYSAALCPAFVGLAQVAVQMPAVLYTAAAAMPLVIKFGEHESQAVNLPVDAGGGPGSTELISGVTQGFTINAVDSATLFTGAFSVVVPEGAAKLEISLVTATAGADLDLYARYGADVDLDNGVIADHLSEGPDGNETITITPQSTPPLRAGRYHIALGVYTTGVDVKGSLTATITAGASPQQTAIGAARLTTMDSTGGRHAVSRKRYTHLVKGLKP